MNFHIHGGSSSSSTTLSCDHHLNGHSSDPAHSRWDSISKARSHIHLLSSLLLSSAGDEDPLSSLSDSDRPARSLLVSSAVYSSISASLFSPSSGSGDDPFCHWLYDAYLASDPDLRLVVLSYVPLISSIYLLRIHHPTSDIPVSLCGFEAVLLAIHSSETKVRSGEPIIISIPDLSQPSLYHSPRSPGKSSNSSKPLVGVLSPRLEPQMAFKSTKRADIVGVALNCYYKKISQMPTWSKLDFCKFVTVWAGQDCPCTSEFDQKPENFLEINGLHEDNNGFEDDITVGSDEIEHVAERVKDLDIEDDNSVEFGAKNGKIPLPWELLQPVLRILGHCLFGPLNVDDVKDAASMAVRCLHARASHDLVPEAILATRGLIQPYRRTREAVKAAATTSAIASGSNVNTPAKVKKPEMLLVSN